MKMIINILAVALLSICDVAQGVTYDLLRGVALAPEERWLETGFVSINDRTWTSISTGGDTYDNDSIVLLSLPDIGGRHYTQGQPTSLRINNLAYNNGGVSFDVKLFHPNDSYCSKEFSVPEYLDDPVQISWIVVNKGVYNISNHHFVVDSGEINRTHHQLAGVGDTVDVFNFEFPRGCNASAPEDICVFSQDVPLGNLGAVSTIQTLQYETYMLTRTSRIRRRDITLILTPHDSADPNYFRFPMKETVGYMVFETGVVISCVEKMTFETVRFDDVTSQALYYDYFYSYRYPPGIYGSLISQNSFVDSTGVRVFERTSNDAYVITQEDQCVENQTIHTTEESVAALVVGEISGTGDEICSVRFTGLLEECTYTLLMFDLFGDGWHNVDVLVTTDGETKNYTLDNCTGCGLVEIVSQDCKVNISMTSNGDPITPWEALWVIEIDNVTWAGDYDSEIGIKEYEVVYYKDILDTDPDSDANECKECKHPKPKGKGKGGKGKSKGGSKGGKGGSSKGGKGGSGDDAATNDDPSAQDDYSPSDDNYVPFDDDFRTDDNITTDDNYVPSDDNYVPSDDNYVPSDDNYVPSDDGSSGDNGAGGKNGFGRGKGGKNGKPKRPPAVVTIDLFDEQENGWYDNSGDSTPVCDSELCENADDDSCESNVPDVPNILSYPRYFIMNDKRTKLIKYGTICKNDRGVEYCDEVLPHDGHFVFRVAGVEPDGDDATWEFCDTEGGINEELQFTMKAGKCHPGPKLTAEEYCDTLESMAVLTGSILLSGVQSGDLSSLDEKILATDLGTLFTNAHKITLLGWKHVEEGLEASFEVTMAVSDAHVFSDVETVVDNIKSHLETTLVDGNFIAELSAELDHHPNTKHDVLRSAKTVSLEHLEVAETYFVHAEEQSTQPVEVVLPSSSSASEKSADSFRLTAVSGVVVLVGTVVVVAGVALALMTRRRTHELLPADSTHLRSVEMNA
eukprot:CAMPEP_0185017106 /NCGR_PEP_ID=MMETSP1103-20130426/60_1 /TAXON_ID=36769 /ORGANISM="Paraphysomonas bandaiensis, Strain Caron Lab Isolate" /LENGTH=966 /DNA_ID=CAMNT_0027546363 /DNA_START=40 /DNA_END=2940 /DNA_ORIENTATION=+